MRSVKSEVVKKTIEKIKANFAEEILNIEEYSKQTFVSVKPQQIVAILKLLRDDSELSYDYLQDICGLDYMNQGMPERFAVVYNLYSYKNSSHFRIKAFVPEEEPEIDSVASLWAAADWAERETFDMYGILFKNHPNLIRILLPELYQGYPLRKDYPLRGRGERANFPKDTL
ncbi:MAG: NADH-quinone oxidoreductase subunit C [Planctomycetota bacterium]